MPETAIAYNGSGLCEVAGNRRRKFRFRRHIAKANFCLLIYKKKPIKLAFADYEAKSFNLDVTPPFCKTLVGYSVFNFSYNSFISYSIGNTIIPLSFIIPHFLSILASAID